MAILGLDVEQAAQASAPITKTSFWKHSRAYMLAVAAYMGIFIFGYDTGLGGGVLVLPTFASEFGITGTATEVANLQGNVVSILQGGCFFGALLGAPITTRIGRKWSLIGSCVVFLAGAAIQTAASGSLAQFYVGRLVCGLGVGTMSMVCPTYVSELSPKEIRGKVTGLFQVIVVIGVAVSYWINYGVTFIDPSRGAVQWRIPIGFQLVPVGIMLCFLPFLKESPRWLATKHREDAALDNLAWIRKASPDDPDVQAEFAEIVAAIREEEHASKGSSWKEIFAKGNPIRFIIAFLIFTFQQWSGQNSISYFAPTIFKSIGIKGASSSLLASGIYGIVKIIATGVFIAFGIERFGRKKSLALGLGLMSMFLWIIGAIFHTHPPNASAENVSSASIGMAVMIYLFVVPYCFSVGPVPWVYCSEIFNNRTRAYGLMTAAASQWFWNFFVSRFTPNMVIALSNGGIFFFFAGINIISCGLALLLPETKGLSLESMDVLFGAVTKEQREADIARRAADQAERSQEEEKDARKHLEEV